MSTLIVKGKKPPRGARSPSNYLADEIRNSIHPPRRKARRAERTKAIQGLYDRNDRKREKLLEREKMTPGGIDSRNTNYALGMGPTRKRALIAALRAVGA